MVDELSSEYAARLEHDKLEALKELAYGASHEINNPLANIAARAQTLLAGEADPERRRMLLAIHRQAMRAHEMISDLMLFARPPKLSLAKCDLAKLIGRVIAEHHEVAAERGTQLTMKLGDNAGATVMADETQLLVAAGALVTNAIEAAGASGEVAVVLDRESVSGQECAVVTVRDDGPGISDHVRQHMFEPFFSGREAGRGLGFGLSKCWRIVKDHGGRVVVRPSQGRGAEISICLPVPD